MWVKVDDGLPDHSKVLAAGRALGTRGAGRVLAIWLQGMCFANRNLTDGFLPESLVRTWTLYDHRPLEVAGAMVDAGLLELVDAGFRFHNYGDYQPDAATIKAKRERERVRKRAARNPSGIRADVHDLSARTFERSRTRDPVPVPVPVPVRTAVLARSERTPSSSGVPRPAADAAGSRTPDKTPQNPAFLGKRIRVYAWQLERLARMLGPHAEAFDLGAWCETLDRRAATTGLVMPQRDLGAWLEAQTLDEAERRGLTVARAAPSHPLGGSMFQPGTSPAEMLAALRRDVGKVGKP